ncbi:MAG: ABC transporter permease [Anaerolineales bacterium]|nr:ABC transporter permease [Anaerolineales bacterium]
MLRFIGSRSLFIAFVCVLIVFFVHLGMRMIPNSDIAEPNFDVVSHGKAAWTDSKTYIFNIFHGELGSVNLDSGRYKVSEILIFSYGNSMGLLLISLIFATAIGVYIGAFTALTKWQRLVLPLLTLTILGVSTPSFFAGLLLQQGAISFYQETGTRLISMAGHGWDFQHLILPVLVLMARPLAYLTRSTNLGLSQVMKENFITTAYSKGLSKRYTVNVHAILNMIVPALTAVGVSLRFSLSSLPVVEVFFAWPGMGLRMLEAINGRQTTLVVSLALAMGLTFLVINLILDIAYRIVDPRLRDTNGAV